MVLKFNMTDVTLHLLNMADSNNSPLVHISSDNITPVSDGSKHHYLGDNIMFNSSGRFTDVDTGRHEKLSSCDSCCHHHVAEESFEIGNESNNNSSILRTENNAKNYVITQTSAMTFEINLADGAVVSSTLSETSQFNLQEAFHQFRKKKQAELRSERQRQKGREGVNMGPARMEELREKIISQTKKYFGVPYAKKYWPPHTIEHKSPIFLDCCGLVRQVIRDLQQDLGFRLGPWNQAYMYDTLPITLTKEQMKPGDLVFMTGVYVNPKNKKQIHNIVHVEVWLGHGDKTIGSRWNNGKVQVFDSYMFSPKSFHSQQYIFKSIDTWLMGICHSHCSEHRWRLKKHKPNRSIFHVEDTIPDEKAECNSDDDNTAEEAFNGWEDTYSDAERSTQSSGNEKEDKLPDKEDIKFQEDDRRTQSSIAAKEDKCPDADKSIESSGNENEGRCHFDDKSIQSSINAEQDKCPDEEDNCQNGDNGIQFVCTTNENKCPDANNNIQSPVTEKDIGNGSKGIPVGLTSINTKIDNEEEFTDIANTSFTSDISFNEFLPLEDTRNPYSEVSITRTHRVIQKVFSDERAEVVKSDRFLPDVDITFLNDHKLCPDIDGLNDHKLSPDVDGFQNSHLELAQILQGSQSIRCNASENLNNNSSKDWKSEFADSCKSDSDDNREMIYQSDFKRNSMLLSLNLYKQRSQGTSAASKERIVQAEGIHKTPTFWLKDADNNTSSLASSVCEQVKQQPLGALDEASHKPSDPDRQRSGWYVWNQRPKRLDEIPLTPERVCRETEDSDTRVARYVLNQWPKRGDGSCDSTSAFQSYVKCANPMSLFDSNRYPPTGTVTEDTIRLPRGYWHSQNKNDDQDLNSVTELYGAKTEIKKSDATCDPTALETLEHRVSEHSTDRVEFTPLCFIDNLNEFTTEHGHAGRKYIAQDNTSNDGGDMEYNDDSQSDDNDDEFTYYDPEKQADKTMMKSLVRFHDDDEHYDAFYESVKDMSDLSRHSSHIDLKNSRFSDDDEPSQKIKISDGSYIEEREGHKREMRSGDEIRSKPKENAFETGGGDTYKEKGAIGGDDKKIGKQSKLPQCCLPTSSVPPTFFVGGANGCALVEGPLLALGWKKTVDRFDENYKLKWVENKSKINYLAFREGEQLVNHIPNCKLLTNKLGLLCSLQDYERMTLLTKGRLPRMKMADFVPETYKLDDKGDREKFLREYQDGETWICKPTSMNQGKGIFLLRSRETVNHLCERDSKSKNVPRMPMMRIVQRYITEPLLLEGRKFDIRSYMFIASTIPFLVLYHKGYARLSCHKYRNEDPNLTTHLTNQFVQKKDPSYKDVKEDTAWTMDKLNDYINKYVAPEKGLPLDWVYGALTRQMQKITLHCFNSVKHKLQSRMGYFDLYGMDFMVDSDMKVWLIEINANPALHTNCQALREAIPSVIEDALYLAIECFEKSCKGEPLMPLNALGGYSVLYCGSNPNSVGQRQIRSVSPFKDITVWNRPSGASSNSKRQSPPHNLTRDHVSSTTSNQTSSTTQVVANKRLNKRISLNNTLPMIKTGVTAGLTILTDNGNNSSSKLTVQKQKHLSSQTKPPQQPQQPNKRTVLTQVLSSEDENKCFMKNSASHVEKPTDKLHRGN